MSEDLEGLNKAQLVEMANREGLEVKRGDGAEGEPPKEDYVAALQAHFGAAKEETKEEDLVVDGEAPQAYPTRVLYTDTSGMVHEAEYVRPEMGHVLRLRDGMNTERFVRWDPTGQIRESCQEAPPV